MASPKKSSKKAQVKVSDLKARKNPKGGFANKAKSVGQKIHVSSLSFKGG